MHRYIDNGSNNILLEEAVSANQSVSKFAEYHIDMISCVHRKCQTRAGVSVDVNKTIEYVTISDSKFYNRVLV